MDARGEKDECRTAYPDQRLFIRQSTGRPAPDFSAGCRHSSLSDITPAVAADSFTGRDLNDRGSVCIEYDPGGGGTPRGLIRFPDGTLEETLNDDGDPVVPYAINNSDEWVGTNYFDGSAVSSLSWESGSGGLGWGMIGYADVNDFGELLGRFLDPVSGNTMAFLEYGNWQFSTGLPADYPFFSTSGYVWSDPMSINHFGGFAGVASEGSGEGTTPILTISTGTIRFGA